MISALDVCCEKCGLHLEATHAVVSSGPSNSGVMWLGEAPGAEEDKAGKPFVGDSGILLDEMIAAAGLRRDDCYVCNVIMCRPPQNKITENHIACCSKLLGARIFTQAPKVMITLGSHATRWILRRANCPDAVQYEEKISLLHGKWFQAYTLHGTVVVFPVYHPAYVLRDPSRKAEYRLAFMQIGKYLKDNKLPIL